MSRFSPRSVGAVCGSGLAALAVAVVPVTTLAGGDQPSTQPSLTAYMILSGKTLSHTFTVSGTTNTASEALTKPDDITELGGFVFVGFQNGVGAQGEPSGDGNTDSTIVAMDRFGKALAQWDLQGKVDGLTADPAIGGLIATVNEDNNSSLYTITPGAHGSVNVQHYTYNEPLPHNGGTDAISILGDQILVSASAPGTVNGSPPAPQPTYPAVYSVSLDPADSVATVSALFNDEDTANVANAGSQGQKVVLALTDPDSSSVVPSGAPRFSRDFMLDSQGDQQQIFVGRRDSSKALSVLNLSQSVDDTAWATGPGVLYATDSTNDAVDVLGGTFGTNPIVAVTPCGANTAPNTCSDSPPTPANYLGSLDPWTGTISQVPVGGADFVPQGGLLFMPFPHEG